MLLTESTYPIQFRFGRMSHPPPLDPGVIEQSIRICVGPGHHGAGIEWETSVEKLGTQLRNVWGTLFFNADDGTQSREVKQIQLP